MWSGLIGCIAASSGAVALHRSQRARRARVARVDAVRPGPLARVGHRLLALPERHRAQALVGGDQVHEVRGARARQADHDDRPRGSPSSWISGWRFSRSRMRSRFAAARTQSLEDREAAEARALGVVVDLVELEREALAEVGGAEVVEAACAPRPRRARPATVSSTGCFSPYASAARCTSRQHGRAQVVDADLLGHQRVRRRYGCTSRS